MKYIFIKIKNNTHCIPAWIPYRISIWLCTKTNYFLKKRHVPKVSSEKWDYKFDPGKDV